MCVLVCGMCVCVFIIYAGDDLYQFLRTREYFLV